MVDKVDKPSGVSVIQSLSIGQITPNATPQALYDFNLATSSLQWAGMPSPRAGRIKNLSVYVGTNLHTEDTAVTIYINGVASIVTITIPASTTGLFTDNTNQAAIALGDRISFVFTDASAGTGVMNMSIMSAEIE